MTFQVSPLPAAVPPELETTPVLRKLARAHRYLAELKGVARTIPNEAIILNTLTLQEAKDSSAIEDIITTHDELYRANLMDDDRLNPAAKEVQDYAAALKRGFDCVRNNGLIRLGDILEIQGILEHNRAGLRKLPGTALTNRQTAQVVYTPPQEAGEIESLMANLVDYINDDALHELDDLLKMAIIHFQFESIHPFYDGNGRTGRIINILYLVAKGLLDLPVLYLSRYITRYKSAYYSSLQAVRDRGHWEGWLLYMLDAIEQTAKQTIFLIESINRLMLQYKHGIREQLPKIYSQDLLNNLFQHPYTKIELLVRDLRVTRLTATRYLEQLIEKGFLTKSKIGRTNYYINTPLYKLFADNPEPAA